MADIRAQLTRVREAANDVAGTATGRIKDSTDKAGELLQTGRDKASDAYSDARDRTQRVATRANEIVQEHPVAVVAGAVAAGAVIAWMFPKSRKAMKALPGLAVTAGARVLEAAATARAAAAESADSIRHNAGDALASARETAGEALQGARESAGHTLVSARESGSETIAAARDAAASADIGGKASKLADDVVALVAARVEALGEAIKARLPKS
ncbi:DUF883 family protein [Sphingobium sp. AP49]|uniref:DUF883 family protein n=1 Tax=Sphingobium sp. AP49 TaxID=1144307 RepID=UPI00026ED3CC|nr:DUF883 family protein [Sphingobium sp. AP49]WHO40642.1 DUF883 family protein [Sphingobium sp. AP49]